MSYSIIIRLSCFFCTFSYHTSKGDCDPDSEHDYCSLHVRLWAGQVTAQSFFKLFWINFFLVGRFLSWQTFIGSNFWWELFLVTSFHWIKFLVGRFLVTLLKYFFFHSFFLHWIGLALCQICIIVFCGQLWWVTLFMWLHVVNFHEISPFFSQC